MANRGINVNMAVLFGLYRGYALVGHLNRSVRYEQF